MGTPFWFGYAYMMIVMRWVLTLWLLVGCGTDKGAASDDDSSADAEDTAGVQDTGPDGPTAGCEDAAEVTWDNWGQSFFRTWCAGCHAEDAPDRHGAPQTLVFDTEGQVFEHRWLIRDSVLESGRMPLGGGLPQAETEILDLYLLCGLRD